MKRFFLLAIVFLSLGASGPVNVTMSPARPTVGDLITLTFPNDVNRVTVAPNAGYEVVRTERNRVVARVFKPGPFVLSGKLVRAAGTTSFRQAITIASVLQPNDSLDPAELKPPRPLPPSDVARIAIACAAAAAILAWAAVLLLARKQSKQEPQRMVSPAEEFRAALGRAARTRDANARIILLAEATRNYLARVNPALRRELTTFELLRAVGSGDSASTIRDLLTAADLAKFSPWGAEARDHGHLIEKLAKLSSELEPKAQAA